MKEKNEYLLTCGCVRVYAYARDARAFVHLIGEGNGKVGRNEKESGGGSEEGGVIVRRKGSRSGDKGGAGREE